jgi:hypothetical protein
MGGPAQFAADNRRKGRRPVGRVAEAILRQVWSIHLRRSGFEDIEPCPDGMLSGPGTVPFVSPRWDCLSHEPTDRERERDHESWFTHAADVQAYYRRMTHMSTRFEDALDRGIGAALSDGADIRRIKADLRCGQSRIERVAKQLRIWMAEKENDDDGEG